jgi:hypothetical protein
MVCSNTTIKGPDAIQLACASEARGDSFVTNDRRLQGKQVDGIQFIVALGNVPIGWFYPANCFKISLPSFCASPKNF